MPPRKRATKPKDKATVDAVQQVSLDAISTYDKNPRIGDIEAISDSLQTNGQFKPIVVQKSTNKILAGNHTYMAARQLGWDTIAVVFVDVDDQRAAKIVLADNRTTDFGGYDESALGEVMAMIDDIAGTGFTQAEADALLEMNADSVRALSEISMPNVAAELPDTDEDDEEPEPETGEWDDVDSTLPGVLQLDNEQTFLPVYDQRNVYEIPELDEELIPDISTWTIDTWVGPDFSPALDTPDKHWIYLVRTSTTGIPWERALPCFFTRDYRFESWWDDPGSHVGRLLNLGVENVIEHDFSVDTAMPTAVLIWQVYKNRWLARYMQEAGLGVIPNIGLLSPDSGHKAYRVPGLPAEPASGAFQLQTVGNNADAIANTARSYNMILNEQVCPRTLLVYGGSVAQKVMKKVSYTGKVIYADTYTALRMKLIEERRKATGDEGLETVRATKAKSARKVSKST